MDEAQAGIKIVGRNINNLIEADDTTLNAESEEELKSPLMKVKEGSRKAGLKLNIQEAKIITSYPIISWHIDRETIETVTDFIFLAPKSQQMVTATMKLKHFLLGRKAMNNLDSTLKSRDISFLTQVHLFKAMFSPVVMYGCKSWTVKKAK